MVWKRKRKPVLTENMKNIMFIRGLEGSDSSLEIKLEVRKVTDSMQEQTEQLKAAGHKKGLSGSTIKIIAIVAMLIDHIGAVIVERMILNNSKGGFIAHDGLYQLDMVLRSIGRIGFPIFCFLLVEGFLHTRNVKKYALRLGIFALISEIPFDLAFSGRVFFLGYQNVFFTLFIGLLVMIAFRATEQNENLPTAVKYLLDVLAFAAGAGLATWLQTDYNGIGVACIMAIYVFRRNRIWQLIAGCAAFLWEIPAPLAFLPIAFYNGERGLKMKYFFYVFYPAHLLVLYLIAWGMGLA